MLILDLAHVSVGRQDKNEFQAILRDIRSKYEREHQRVRLWLEENGLL